MNGATRKAQSEQNDRWIVRTAIRDFGCGRCRARPGDPCVSFRGDSYAEWFVHMDRRSVLDEAFMRGFRLGRSRPRATDDKGRVAS